MKKILIIGGGGYIGSALVPFLAEAGYKVDVTDLFWFGNYLPDAISTQTQNGFNLTQKDFEPYHTVILLAGISNDPMAEFSPKDNFIYNTGLPAFVGFMCREAGVKRLIFASSCSVYGYTHNQTFTETDLTFCNYPYGVSKLQGEQSLLALADENFSVICFRQGTVAGYSPRMRLDLAMNTMFKNALENGEIQLSNSKIWRPILGITDLCKAYKLAIESDINGGEVFNISSFNTTVGEMARSIAIYISEQFHTEVKITDKNIQDYRNYKVSTDKATRLLNYKPVQNDLDIIRNLHEHLSLFSHFEDENYYNIRVFEKIKLDNQIVKSI